MTTSEFSNEFDVLYNNIMSNQAPGLDEYEKSVFLTKAQNEILKNYFNPKGNKYQEGFDGNRKRQIDFSSITKVEKSVNLCDPLKGSPYDSIQGFNIGLDSVKVKDLPVGTSIIDSRSAIFELPTDIFLIINESVEVFENYNPASSVPEGYSKGEVVGRPYTVVPISMSEYDRLQSKPFRYPLKRQAWRLLHKDSETYAEIIYPNTISLGRIDSPSYKYTGLLYTIRYLKYPYPIILTPLPDGLSIEGYTGSNNEGEPTKGTATQGLGCELDDEIHPEILQRAVELAKAAYAGDINSTVEMGKRSE